VWKAGLNLAIYLLTINLPATVYLYNLLYLWVKVMASPFLQYIAEFMYARRYAKRTVDAYVYWIKAYILFHKKQHPAKLTEQDVERF